MNWMGLFLFLATAVTFFVFGAICMAAVSAKEKEDIYTDAYKLGYEVGKKYEYDRIGNIVDNLTEGLKKEN